MSDEKLLHQDEIDALLKAAGGGGEKGQTAPSQDAGSAAESGGEKAIAGVSSGEEIRDSVSETSDQLNVSGDSIPSGSDSARNMQGKVYEQQEDDLENALGINEKDALGEIGNISMGSAATTLSQLLNKRVLITSPLVTVTRQKDFLRGFKVPFLVIKVKFKEGFDGYNVLIIKMHDAGVMANLMMGGDGVDIPHELSEMEISATAEAMNQMIGTASTSLADLLDRSVNITPPEVELVRDTEAITIDLPFSDPIVVIYFRMNIENLLDTNIMQVIDLDTARKQAELLWKKFGGMEEEPAAFEAGDITELPGDLDITSNAPPVPEDETMDVPGEQQEPHYAAEPAGTSPSSPRKAAGDDTRPSPPLQIDQDKLNLLMDIPLKVSVVLGRTKKQIKDVLQMTPGAIVELETMVEEPVEILVNGKLVARGEVVVVNENFGVKISSIISTKERITSLENENFN